MTTNDVQPAGPLKGLKIVDISTVVAGPFAAVPAGRLRRRRS
jgi:crotonobetainyl-CoA:carnitine CoA-transferase CaiB-like acyl-CoA transferase